MSEHYYTPKPTSHLKKKTVTTNINGVSLTFVTATGVFSRQTIDLGTKILLKHALVKETSSVLDLGCGYGIVGIFIAKTVPAAKIVMTDVNERATKLAQENAELNNVVVDIRTGNGYETVQQERFDYILLNPPQTAGRALCFQLIEQAQHHLNKEGIFYLVARHSKGGAVLEQKMNEIFGNAETVARESGFRVYKSVNKSF